nr:MAG TPA: hypothetical protein [Caudoviricetes sp.]
MNVGLLEIISKAVKQQNIKHKLTSVTALLISYPTT